jgi:hypothetical protein
MKIDSFAQMLKNMSQLDLSQTPTSITRAAIRDILYGADYFKPFLHNYTIDKIVLNLDIDVNETFVKSPLFTEMITDYCKSLYNVFILLYKENYNMDLVVEFMHGMSLKYND